MNTKIALHYGEAKKNNLTFDSATTRTGDVAWKRIQSGD